MGRSVNKVTLIGTLGRDPEVRYMPNGNAVANLSLATDESYNDKQTGQKVEQTEWHRITVYGKLAEIIQQYLKKGSRAYFEGKLRTREWEKDGVKRYTTEIIANDMMMLDSRGDNNGGGYGNQGMAQPMGGMNNPGMNQPMGQGGYQQPQQQPPQQPQQQAPMTSAPQQGYQQQPAPQHAPQQQQPMQQPPQQQPAPQPGYQQPQQPQQAPQPSNNFDDFDDDIPF
ncbi:hypothetical protein GCM10011297_19330 [Bacterioplanes sanyensis]|uniref:single-stranded DNA-binding protein n=1 Tax=Bacterioplanes sanyensis TaxID=1249553 RepID=UPI001677F6E1|nr:single-stranded DNA-binding protein [Bacterioplanes sanyensis]GGY46622.1 hypothetical protein GCM10011297_19330 [Bacterioplanes sanyensis]